MHFLASEVCFWPLVASMRTEVKKINPMLNLNEFWTKSAVVLPTERTLKN